ncbi:MAG: GGDEF domain-containing protein [Rhodocyclales bacterium]|nr:GGDEF domain-containing protein [Rhodocyclales bacterium]
MKLNIAQRFALVLAAAGILAAGLTGYYAYHASRELLLRAAEERLLTSTRVLMRQVATALQKGGQDVLLLGSHPRTRAALAPAASPERAAAEDDIAALFVAMLKTRPDIYQLRLITTAEHGMERVRVDRDEHGLIRVRGGELQEKGHFPYVFETLRLPAGAVYVSNPVINHERGAHAGEHKPSVHLATPIHAADGTPIGLIVLNADLNWVFRLLASDLPEGIGLYLTNGHGDFLLHPDTSQAFAFDRGKRILVQDQFPDTARLIDGQTDQVVTTATPAGASVAAFIRQQLNQPQDTEFFILGLSQPTAAVLSDSDALGTAILRIVFAFSVLSLVLAVLLARAVTGPLNQMVRAVQRFTAVQERAPLPIARQDEIGVLARSFDEMQAKIEFQMGSLQAKQLELDHLASHDPLTGLPNRRVFLDRVEHALNRARRTETRLAILFVDLDHFKEVNDKLGHAVGDVMLLAVADRMRTTVRAADTVARLGGDEFIILVEDVENLEAVAMVARKIIESLAHPVWYQGQSLAVGASIGIAVYPRDGATTTEVIASADQAMYRAKLSGRNRYCLASEAAGDAHTIPLDL